jgi:hypothetical protein
MDLDPLHHFGEGEVSHSVIGNDVHQHSGPLSTDVRRPGNQPISRLSKSDATGPKHEKVTRTFYVLTRAAVYRGGSSMRSGGRGGGKPAA